MGLSMTSSVKFLTNIRTVDNQNCQEHHRRVMQTKTVVCSSENSVRRRNEEPEMNRKCVRRVLIADFHLCPHSLRSKQKLLPVDISKPMIVCQGTREECGRVIENFAPWTQICLQQRRAHLEHVFWVLVKPRVLVVHSSNFVDFWNLDSC